MRKKLSLCSGLLLVATNAFALSGTGSVDFSESVIPILDTNPPLKRFILCNFDVVSDPMGTRLGDAAFPHLGGQSTGPYSMWANWQGPTGPERVIVTVDTTITFLDGKGHPLPGSRSQEARKIVERAKKVEIESPDPDQPVAVPGGVKFSANKQFCR